MKKSLLVGCLISVGVFSLSAQSVIRETQKTMKTYPFSDPDPVANPDKLYYPYFRFDGYTDKGVDKEWKVIEMENKYIKLSIFPEIGGKIWGAIDKATNTDFIYFNHAVKFRDIAMRGAWTSGGIEFNFGIIGHAPTSSTPVDYLTRTNKDGSVSCFISAVELITRTSWCVEVNLPEDKAYFTTRIIWYNSSSVDQPYYHWMNAGYKAEGNLEFCYPGQSYIGHGGDVHSFPIDKQGTELSWYNKNNFGLDKSYHVLGEYNDFYAAYWHDRNMGSAHYAPYDEKLGMKIFLWGLSRSGEIWEKLLTDTDGQYVELQSGRVYNQPATASAYTPYKHFAFTPQQTDTWTEYWFPVKGTDGISKVSPIGALHVERELNQAEISFCPLQKVSSVLTVFADGKKLYSKPLELDVLQLWKETIPLTGVNGKLKVVIGTDELVYSEASEDRKLNRPTTTPNDFNWDSAYGLYLQGEQYMNQKINDKAEVALKQSLEKEPYYLPALTKIASLYYRLGRYEEALTYCSTALSINTYDGAANYIYGLVNTVLGKYTDAKDGFSVASYSGEVRSAGYAKLSQRYLADKNWKQAEHYALKSLESNQLNIEGIQSLLVAYRYSGQTERFKELLKSSLEVLPLNHSIRFEAYMFAPDEESEKAFVSLVRNELPSETYLDIAGWYESIGFTAEALNLLRLASSNPVALYRMAYLQHTLGKESESKQLLEKATALTPGFVFPFRPESLPSLTWAIAQNSSWTSKYYAALIYWNGGLKNKALALLEQCNDAAYAPLFMTRALLKTGNQRLADLQRAEQLDASWRTGLALINYYFATGDFKQALSVATKYYKKYPQNYILGLKYAKTLCQNGQYDACIALLSKLQVLPNEGSSEGRVIYREAHLYQAINNLQAKKYTKALRMVTNSTTWIENLGVGKPYDEDIDSRFENYITALIYEKQGNTEESEKAYLRVVSQKSKLKKVFNSNDYLIVLALRKLNKEQEANNLMKEWIKKNPGSNILNWCYAMYCNDTEKAKTLLSENYVVKDAAPWETVYNDFNFNLILKLLTKE